MNYDKYLELQTRLEWFYDFHQSFLMTFHLSRRNYCRIRSCTTYPTKAIRSHYRV